MGERTRDLVDIFEANERRYRPRWRDLRWPRPGDTYQSTDEDDELDEPLTTDEED